MHLIEKINFRAIINVILTFIFLSALSLPPQQSAKATFSPHIVATPYQNTPIMGKTELNLGVYLENINVGAVGGYFRLKLYSPEQPTCSGNPVFAENIIFSESNSILNYYMIPNRTSNLYSLPNGHIADKTGIWNWVVAFNSGDENMNQSTSTNCGDIQVPVFPSAGTAPQVKLLLTHSNATMQVGDTTTAQMFSPNISPYASGTVQYKLFGNPYCLGTPIRIIQKNYQTIQLNNGIYTGGFFESSGVVEYTQAGIYGWQATYSGDASTAGASTFCSNVKVLEPNTYQRDANTYNAPVGSTLNASITRIGVSPTDPGYENGSFALYGPNDPSCSNTPVYTQNIAWVETAPGVHTATTSPGYPALDTGTYQWRINGSTCGSIAVTVFEKFSPEITLQFSSAQSFNWSVAVTSFFTGSSENAGGSFTYYEYPSNNCTGTPQQKNQIHFFGVPIFAYTQSAAFPALGNYSWKVQYSGDASNNSATSNCAAVQIIAPVAPTLSLQVSDSTVAMTGTSLIVSEPVTASATLGGTLDDASGLITYRLFEGATCAEEDYLRTLDVVSVSDSSIPQSRSAYFFGLGTVYFQAHFSGDSNYQSAVSNCVPVEIVNATPTVSLQLSATTGNEGAQVSARGSITNNAGFAMLNDFTFKVYSDSACTIEYATPDTIATIVNDMLLLNVPSSSAVTFNQPGKYYWRIFYGGGSSGFSNTAASECGSAVLTITPAQPVLFASPNGLSSGACDSWVNACDLQYALSIAQFGHSIWAKAGTYTPHASERDVSFALKNDVAIYGGFAGTENQFSQRNPAANVTILSGDIGAGGDNSDNSYHVVVGSNTNDTAVLDGFTISDGNANGDTYTGGGMLIQNGSPTLKNITFKNNAASAGGGMYASNSQSAISHTTFTENSAPGDGGGAMYLASSNVNLTNVTISNNTAADSGYGGGGILINNSSPSLVNVTIANNINGGFSYYGGTPKLINTIIANNTMGDCHDNPNPNPNPLDNASVNNLIADASNACVLVNGLNGNIVGVDPLLSALANNGGGTQTHALLLGSPAIDAGTNTDCPAADQRGVIRPQGALCDIGAYEKVAPIDSIAAQDGWVLESTETSNKGGKLNSGGATINIGDDAANRQYRAILSFDTTLPAGAIITKATLKFKYAGKTGTLPFSTHGKLLVDVKKGAFSNNPALAKGDFNAGANKNALFSLGKSTGWFSKVFSAGQLTYINTSGVTQFRLRFTKDDNNDLGADLLKIYSGSAGSNAPQLIIEYYVP